MNKCLLFRDNDAVHGRAVAGTTDGAQAGACRTRGDRGFSLIEVMIATVVLVIGLIGVAGMQLNALSGTFQSDALATGSDTAQAWSEWIKGLVSHTDQNKISYFDTGDLWRENFVRFASFDDKEDDTKFVEVYLPSSINDIVDCFNGLKSFTTSRGEITMVFRKEGGGAFTARDMPPAPNPGSRLMLRVYASIPVANTATIEMCVPYSNAFVYNKGAALRMVIASNM